MGLFRWCSLSSRSNMGRGPKKHMKRLAAPSHWMLDKLTGVWAPRPTAGPHKLRECLPLVLLMRNRLRYALTRREVTLILMQRLLKVDGKVRTDANFPAGFMDVITIEKTDEKFRLLFDTKGRFTVHRLKDAAETKFKLCKITKLYVGQKGIPFAVTHDGRTLRYPNPDVKLNDTVKLDLTSGKNKGRVGTIEHKERHLGSFDIVHIKDAAGRPFATRATNVFVIGHHGKPLVSLPSNNGVKLSIIEDRERKLSKNASSA